jgi:hypothetical protein
MIKIDFADLGWRDVFGPALCDVDHRNVSSFVRQVRDNPGLPVSRPVAFLPVTGR